MLTISKHPIGNHNRNTLIIISALILTLFAAVPRFWHLGELGFIGDEETTSLPSRAFAEGNGATMPSGMPYRRALPQTWVNAYSAKLFGMDNELSYRIPSAVIGTLTVPAIFLLLIPFTGITAAAISALLLAASEWHILLSREARMYAPFLFFYLTCGIATWRWAETQRLAFFALAAFMFIAATSMHALSVFCAIFPLVPLAFPAFAKVRQTFLLLFSGAMLSIAWAYPKYISHFAYDNWIKIGGRSPISSNVSAPATAETSSIGLDFWSVQLALIVIGVALGVWLIRSSKLLRASEAASWWRTIGLISLMIAASATAVTAHLHATALLGILFLMIYPGPKKTLLSRIRYPFATILIISCIHTAQTFATMDIVLALKRLIAVPYPTLLTFGRVMPLIIFVYFFSIAYLALTDNNRQSNFARMCVIAAIVPIFAIGSVSGWGNLRYLIEAYPFILISTSLGLVALYKYLRIKFLSNHYQWQAAAVVAAALLIVFPSHGIYGAYRAATISYGTSTPARGFPFYPDHKTPGEFVRQILGAGDIVVVEDAIQQIWYAGQVDYWLRSPSLEAQFHYTEVSSGLRKDIYVSSKILAGHDIRPIFDSATNRIFLITSGETQFGREYYLDPDQLSWINYVEATCPPLMVGLDGYTKVYCLNCSDRTTEPTDSISDYCGIQ